LLLLFFFGVLVAANQPTKLSRAVLEQNEIEKRDALFKKKANGEEVKVPAPLAVP